MMYRYYINKGVLVFIDVKDKTSFIEGKDTLIIDFTGEVSKLMKYVYLLRKGEGGYRRVIVVSDTISKVNRQFLKLFKKIRAAGGLVVNDKEELLFIYKNQRWRLPKGKIKKKESKKDAALREVSEEANVRDLKIVKKLGVTNTLKQSEGGRWTVKICHWYLMTAPIQKLAPRQEEGIEKAFWMSLNDYKTLNPKVSMPLKNIVNFASFFKMETKVVEYEQA